MADEGQLTNGTGDTEEQAIDLDGAEEEEVVDRSPNIGLNMYSTLQPEEDARPAAIAADSESPLFVSEGSPSATSEDIGVALDEEAVRRNGIAVIVPPVQNGWEYRRYDELPVATEILENYDDGGLVEYLVRFDDESEEVVSS